MIIVSIPDTGRQQHSWRASLLSLIASQTSSTPELPHQHQRATLVHLLWGPLHCPAPSLLQLSLVRPAWLPTILQKPFPHSFLHSLEETFLLRSMAESTPQPLARINWVLANRCTHSQRLWPAAFPETSCSIPEIHLPMQLCSSVTPRLSSASSGVAFPGLTILRQNSYSTH